MDGWDLLGAYGHHQGKTSGRLRDVFYRRQAVSTPETKAAPAAESAEARRAAPLEYGSSDLPELLGTCFQQCIE